VSAVEGCHSEDGVGWGAQCYAAMGMGQVVAKLVWR
jgi:hypothetical protein